MSADDWSIVGLSVSCTLLFLLPFFWRLRQELNTAWTTLDTHNELFEAHSSRMESHFKLLMEQGFDILAIREYLASKDRMYPNTHNVFAEKISKGFEASLKKSKHLKGKEHEL